MGIGIRRYAPQERFIPEGAKIANLSFELVNSSERFLDFLRQKNIRETPLDFDGFFKNVTNISLKYEYLGDSGISGSLRCMENLEENDSQWVITINADQHPRRQRFTIAHELGHYCLHRNRESSFEDTIFFRSYISNSLEWQANRFASEILMPEKGVRDGWNQSNKTAESLAVQFDVSILAMRIRLEQLQLLNQK